MNQIIRIITKSKLYKAVLWIVLLLSILIIFCSVFYLFYLIYRDAQKNQIVNYIMQPSHISTLYSATIIPYDNFDYSGIYHSIGTLEIPAIKLNLPILSELNDDLLKLSACHFYGPTKNTVGNICIAGHNYNDGSLFSNIPRLSIGDVIIFTDLNNNICYYTVYDKFEISSNNTACTSQDTNGQKEITLVTCNNFTGNRVIVKAISL